MPRKNGCPFSVKDWQIDIMDPASNAAAPIWVRIKGLDSATRGYDSDTEDGSSASDVFGEPYKTKITGNLSVEGKPVRDPVTGDRDPGQELLDHYALLAGCDADARIRMADPVGHVTLLDVQVTSAEVNPSDTEETASWEMEMVGEPEFPAYVQATAVAVQDSGAPVTALTLAPGDTKELTVSITPANASNQRYSVISGNPRALKVGAVDGNQFMVTAIATQTAPVNLLVRTMNNRLEATVAVTIEV